jgi:hypothetical protein
VARTDLPRETRHQPLDYDGLIAVLETVDGEGVVVQINSRGINGGLPPGAASIIGQLHQVPARYDGHEFAIGSPYPDRDPGRDPVGGVLFFNAQTFESATLTTFDGNDYFLIAIKTDCIEILIQDDGSSYP